MKKRIAAVRPVAKSPVTNKAISIQVGELAEEVQEVKRQVGLLNPNGKAPALLSLADAAPSLLKLAEVAPRLIDVAEKQADLDGFWRVIRRFGNPLKPAGAVFWLVLASFVAALAYRFVGPGSGPG